MIDSNTRHDLTVMTEHSEVEYTVLNKSVTTYTEKKFVFFYYHSFESLVLYTSYALVCPAHPPVHPLGCIIPPK
jgi:hypothetical protein